MKKYGVVLLVLFSAVTQAQCLPGASQSSSSPLQRGETRYLLPMDHCARLESDFRLGVVREAAGSRLFWDYQTQLAHAPVGLRLTAWNLKKDALVAPQGQYWGPEVQIANPLALRLGLMIPATENRKPIVAASLTWAY